MLTAIAIVATVAACELIAIATAKIYRERIERIETRVRERLLDDLIEVIERDDLPFDMTGVSVSIGERRFDIPAPRGLAGRATRETIISLIATISGTGRARLVDILERAEYVDRALRLLVSGHPAVRVRACMILGGMMSRRAVPWLSTRFIDDDHAAVRLAAAEALARIGDPPSASVLLRAIHNRTRWQHLRIANVLSQMGTAAVPTLQRSLTSEDDRVVLLSLDILSDIGLVDDVEHVKPLLSHANPEVRARAVELLGIVGDLSALDSVIAACGDSVGFVRVRAAKTLGHFGLPGDRLQAQRYLETLERLKRDSVWWVRQHAAGALAAAGAQV